MKLKDLLATISIDRIRLFIGGYNPDLDVVQVISAVCMNLLPYEVEERYLDRKVLDVSISYSTGHMFIDIIIE